MLIKITIALLVIHIVCGINPFNLCLPLSQMIDQHQQVQSSQEIVQGRRGKSGPPGRPGSKGDQGDFGPPGQCDCDDNQRFQGLVDQLKSLNETVQRLVKVVQPPSNDINQVNSEVGKFYVFSDTRTDANSASETCSSMGGRLAQIKDNSQNSTIIKLMQQKYNQEQLVTVDVYVNPSKPRANKFRGREFRDRENIENWNRPPRGNLKSFKLFQRATGDFSTRATFCFFIGRDNYRGVCDQGWRHNFNLFGGTPETENAITLRRVYANNPGSSRLLLPGQPIPDGFAVPSPDERNYITLTIPGATVQEFRLVDTTRNKIAAMKQLQHTLSEISISDNSVFIGAKSDVGETSWFWSDGTAIADADYPTSNASVCQQMSWPLTYDNGINLLPKPCDDQAYFACEY